MSTSQYSIQRLLAILFCLVPPAAAAEDIIVADFEAADYGHWKVEGDAFGPSPAKGTLANQQQVSGFSGDRLVNTYFKGDNSTGTLTSPPRPIEPRHLNFLIGGGHRPGEAMINLLVDGKSVRGETGGDDEKLDWVTWELAEFAGKSAVIQIVDKAKGGWGHINVDQIVLSDTAKAQVRVPVVIKTDVLYDETYRPQFHFTAQKGWLNDPNGLVYFKGEYHLFFQHNPLGTEWGNMTWGQSVSKDLVRWKHLPNAIERDALGTIFSGSAVIDWNNIAGFGKEAMICLYTSAGGTSPESKGKPFTQSLAYSTDGRTFKKFDGNPVLKHISGENRDPKVFWHQPGGKWIMALYVDVKEGGKTIHTIQFFSSSDLKEWVFLSRIDGYFECPDIFELPVDGDAKNRKWVLFGADGDYAIGRFDGKTFTPEPRKHKSDWGANFYAAQTYSDIPTQDGRRILIGWMRGGKYPQMPFNQQMTFPVELTLRSTADGVRMCKWPVKEIAGLVAREQVVRDAEIKAGANPLAGIEAELLDIEAEIEPGEASSVLLDVRGVKLKWSKEGKLECAGRSADLKPIAGRIKLRLLVDRASIEVFGNGGEITMSSCVLPRPDDRKLGIASEGGSAKIVSMVVRELKSAWR